jgi:hypothetical protein
MELAITLGPDEFDKAVEQGHALIAARPMDFTIHHRLFDLYDAYDRRDEAMCVARGLKFLKQANTRELELAASVDDELKQAHGALSREAMRMGAYHPSESLRLSDVFSLIWPMIAAREGRTHAHFSLDRANRTQVNLQASEPLARFIAYACQVLDAPVPDFFPRPGEPGDLLTAALTEFEGGQVKTVFPTLLAGSDALAKQGDRAWLFRAARAVTRARPEHILAAVLPSGTSLRQAVYGAIMVSHPGVAIPEDLTEAARAYAVEIQRYLPPARLDQLRTLITRLIETAGADTRAWVQGVSFTATRLGFALCDDLETAARIVTQEDDNTMVSAKDRMRDLVAYSMSLPYFSLRRALGFAS